MIQPSRPEVVDAGLGHAVGPSMLFVDVCTTQIARAATSNKPSVTLKMVTETIDGTRTRSPTATR